MRESILKILTSFTKSIYFATDELFGYFIHVHGICVWDLPCQISRGINSQSPKSQECIASWALGRAVLLFSVLNPPGWFHRQQPPGRTNLGRKRTPSTGWVCQQRQLTQTATPSHWEVTKSISADWSISGLSSVIVLDFSWPHLAERCHRLKALPSLFAVISSSVGICFLSSNH